MKFKSILLTLAVLFFCSCGSIPFSQDVYVFDLRKYSEEGFFITPFESNFSYIPIGEIQIVTINGSIKTNIEPIAERRPSYVPDDYMTHERVSKKSSQLKIVDSRYLTDELVSAARSLGADAIINFKIYVGESTYSTSTVSGFAVKRIE